MSEYRVYVSILGAGAPIGAKWMTAYEALRIANEAEEMGQAAVIQDGDGQVFTSAGEFRKAMNAQRT